MSLLLNIETALGKVSLYFNEQLVSFRSLEKEEFYENGEFEGLEE